MMGYFKDKIGFVTATHTPYIICLVFWLFFVTIYYLLIYLFIHLSLLLLLLLLLLLFANKQNLQYVCTYRNISQLKKKCTTMSIRSVDIMDYTHINVCAHAHTQTAPVIFF